MAPRMQAMATLKPVQFSNGLRKLLRHTNGPYPWARGISLAMTTCHLESRRRQITRTIRRTAPILISVCSCKMERGIRTEGIHMDRPLYLESVIAEPLNHGHESGCFVALIPQPKATGWDQVRLQPFWLGTSMLPEQRTVADVEADVAGRDDGTGGRATFEQAVAAGANPSTTKFVLHSFASKRELLRFCASSIRSCAPEDGGVADAFTIPETGVPPLSRTVCDYRTAAIASAFLS